MKFYIKQKVFSLRDQFKIMDANQKELYQVAGKFFSIANKLELQNMNGSVVLKSQRKVLTFLPKYFIYTPHDDQVATIQRKFGLKPNFNIDAMNRELRVQGSIFGHNFDVFDGDNVVASIQKRVISWGDTYEIDIADESNVELYLFIVIIIDQVVHENKQKRVNFN